MNLSWKENHIINCTGLHTLQNLLTSKATISRETSGKLE